MQMISFLAYGFLRPACITDVHVSQADYHIYMTTERMSVWTNDDAISCPPLLPIFIYEI